jgi:molybdate transport system substrate-binding protein
MRRPFYFLMGVLLVALLGGCMELGVRAVVTPAEEATGAETTAISGDLVVFAAASLTEAFEQIGEEFAAAHPDSAVTFNFAGSQQLAQQLGQGAPADVFASANNSQMEVAVEAGRVISGAPRTFVRNRLVVIYPADNPAGLTTLQDLAQPGLKLVLAAPAVPVGGYSLDFLEKASATVDYGEVFSPTVLSNVVSYEENVRAVLSKVALGEADAGIVYTSDIAGDAAEQVGRIDIPDELNTIATYPIAPVADARQPEAAQAFIDLVLSTEGQAVLARHGFIPAAGD